MFREKVLPCRCHNREETWPDVDITTGLIKSVLAEILLRARLHPPPPLPVILSPPYLAAHDHLVTQSLQYSPATQKAEWHENTASQRTKAEIR